MATVSSGLNSGSGFANSDVVTSTNLNNHVNSATVTNIANADVASNAAIEVTKLEELPAQSCIINPTASAAVPDEHPIVIGGSGDAGILFDNDDMLDNSDTAGGSAARGATQQSIKAYVDASSTDGFTPSTYSGEESVTFPNGLIIKFGTFTSTSDGDQTFSFDTAFPTACVSVTTGGVGSGDLLKSASGFTINRFDTLNGSIPFFWQAIGH